MVGAKLKDSVHDVGSESALLLDSRLRQEILLGISTYIAPQLYLMKTDLVKCPKCSLMAGHEVPRRWWMYLIPWAKNYYCVECYHEFAIIFGNITI